MEKILRIVDSHQEADEQQRFDDNALTYQQRFAAHLIMQLPEDFKEFIALMISNNVRFVMIGGYAYNLYRNPRATGDIDFILSTDATNDAGVRKVLTEFGFGSSSLRWDVGLVFNA